MATPTPPGPCWPAQLLPLLDQQQQQQQQQ
jgi:hypothetical protein